jgi:hypothetical protein
MIDTNLNLKQKNKKIDSALVRVRVRKVELND